MNDIPTEVQLQIYDYFLSLRNYKRHAHHFYPIITQMKKNFDDCNDEYCEEFGASDALSISDLMESNELFKNIPCSEPPILQDIETLPTQINANYQLLKLYRMPTTSNNQDYLYTDIYPYKIIVEDSVIGHINLILFSIRTREFKFDAIYNGNTYKILACFHCSRTVVRIEISDEMNLWMN